ncbi:MAG TPA: hypothetical protein VFT84_11020, partial [Gemmatimonadales bacterium]|nr:hypothetical protein [Gemmatimonadales bacterium]
ESDAPVVVKLGGGLLETPGALEASVQAVAALALRWRVVVVPGGGPLADAVRRLDERVGLSDDAAHWMAILAMAQYAHVLAERIERSVRVEEPGGIAEAFAAGRVAVLAPSRWMRSADVLPHTWDATSDSVAAFVAGALGARHLVLVKPADGEPEALVDRCFTLVVPAGLPWTAVGWRSLGEVPALVERSASA